MYKNYILHRECTYVFRATSGITEITLNTITLFFFLMKNVWFPLIKNRHFKYD